MAGHKLRPFAVIFLGGLTFLLAIFIMKAKLPFALLSAGVGALTGVIISRKQVGSLEEFIVDGVSRDEFEAGLKAAWAKHRALADASFRIRNPIQRKKVDAIAAIVAKILEDIKADPKDFKAARQFLEYYLDATVKVVKQYVELGEKASTEPDIAESLKKVEDTLDTIQVSFEKQLRLLLENDKLDLDVELTVLKRTLEMEGLSSIPDTNKRS